jgi:hypothetical protein
MSRRAPGHPQRERRNHLPHRRRSAYREDEFALAGPAVDRIELAAAKTASCEIDTITVTIRVTEALTLATVSTGAHLAVGNESGAVVRSAAATPSLIDNDNATLRWTLTGAERTALVSDHASDTPVPSRSS